MSNSRTISVSQSTDYYKINVQEEKALFGTWYLVVMIIGFFLCLIGGIVMLVLWLVKFAKNGRLNTSFDVSKSNWKEQLDSKISLQNFIYNNFKDDTENFKQQIITKLR